MSQPIRENELEFYQKNAKSECEICLGSGIIDESPEETAQCLCVVENLKEKETDSRE